MLYPDDSTPAGKMLRLKQEYFFTCAGLNSIVKAHLRVYPNMNNFHEKNVIQLNDTHPVLAIPELMRILIDEKVMNGMRLGILQPRHLLIQIILF